jgi:CarD family transcriptional regulator
MFKVGEYLVYKREVCKLVEIKPKHINDVDYYTLISVFDNSLKIEVPVSNKFSNLRPLMSREEIDNIIKQIPNVNILKCEDERLIENSYKQLTDSGDPIDLIKIIKTTYLRNKEKIDQKKKIGDREKDYFQLAEKYLYQEFSIVLDIDYDDTKKYVINEINKLDR